VKDRKLERLSRQVSLNAAERAGFATRGTARGPRWTVRVNAFVVTVAVIFLVVAGSAIVGDDKFDVAGADVATATLRPECPNPPAGGDHVEVTGVWGGEERDRFGAVLQRFVEESGINVTFATGSPNAERPDRELAANLQARIANECPPDVALLPQPGLLSELAREKHIKPLPQEAKTLVRLNYSKAWQRLATIDRELYGVWFKASNKSLVWYRSDAFQRAGVRPPETWAGLKHVAGTLAGKGMTPFSVAGADGWTLTDWFENIYLRTAGPEMYDRLARHEIPWTHPSVERALEILAQVFGRSDWLAGGTQGALQTDFEGSVANVFGDPPTAAMVYEADFVANHINEVTGAPPGHSAKVFPFPTVGESKPAAMALGGDVAVLLNDRETAARRLIRFLATPEAAEPWARQGGFTSPNKELDLDVYPDEITRESARALARARSIRFDLSDLQPAAFGATPGQGMWKIFQDFLTDPSQIDRTAERLERCRSAPASEAATCHL
jgi:alpha-glucoside transport system substrate-binding protein